MSDGDFNHVAFEVIQQTRQSNPAHVTFKNITYTVRVTYFDKRFIQNRSSPFHKKTKYILDDVNGYASPGEFIALMGLSGAGKSTLLDILCGIRKKGKISGEVKINNRDVKHYKDSIGYVSQSNFLLKTQTVKEALMFYATLKSPPFTRRRERLRVVNEIMEILNLKHIENTVIGDDATRGISGGEKKRVSIGCELVTNPSVLYLDEPTTGLDAFGSLSVVDLLQKLSRRGTTIVCTIHQPRALVFEKFDKIIMLSKGRVMYFGPPSLCPSFLIQSGFNTNDNIADAMIDAITFETGNPQARNFFNGKFWRCQERIDEIVSVDAEELKKPDRSHRGFWELKYFFALLFGSIFFGTENTQQGVRTTSGVMYFVITISVMMVMDFMIAFVLERPLMRRETNKNLYSTTSYFISTVLHVSIILAFNELLSSAIMYPMLGLRGGFIHFLVFLCALTLTAFVSQALFYLIGSISPNVLIAQIIAPLILIVFMVFSGFFILKDDIPPYWIWAYYISYLRYSFNILMINQFQGTTIECTQSELVSGVCPITSGDQFLDEMSIEPGMLVDFFVLFGFYVLFQICCYIAIHIFWREKR
ncbi:ABC transporter [Entamoeba marina]